MATFHRTATMFRQGSTTMPAEYYVSPTIFAEETEKIRAATWHCVGRAERISRPGDFFTFTIAGEPLIIVRDRHGVPRAHFNICRHRGTRLCEKESGHFSETIQCQYHAWTYTTDGRLIGAPHMQDVAGFAKADHGLHQAQIAEWEGFLFVNLDPDASPLSEWIAPLANRLARFGLGRLAIGRKIVYEVQSNWKLIFQNYSECLHCPTIHPELNRKLPYTSGANDLVEGPFLGGYMELTEGNDSVTVSGKRIAPWIADLSVEDQRRAYYYSIMPNLLLSLHPDYVNYYLVRPVSAEKTVIESEWLFDPSVAGSADFDPQDAVEMWDVTNRQDWHITEESLIGIKSRRYQPGPYSARESVPAAWDRSYLELMGRSADGGR